MAFWKASVITEPMPGASEALAEFHAYGIPMALQFRRRGPSLRIIDAPGCPKIVENFRESMQNWKE